MPGVLPDCPVSLLTSRMSSESWKATPSASHAGSMRVTISSGAPENMAPNRPDVAISDPVFSITTRQ